MEVVLSSRGARRLGLNIELAANLDLPVIKCPSNSDATLAFLDLFKEGMNTFRTVVIAGQKSWLMLIGLCL